MDFAVAVKGLVGVRDVSRIRFDKNLSESKTALLPRQGDAPAFVLLNAKRRVNTPPVRRQENLWLGPPFDLDRTGRVDHLNITGCLTIQQP